MSYLEEIKKLRILTGLSQSKFAKKIQASPSSVSAWELGKAKPDSHFQKILIKLAQELEYKAVGHDL